MKKKMIVIIVAAIVSVTAIVGGINVYINSILSKVNKEEKIETNDANINIVHKEDTAHKVVNFLLLGVDNDNGNLYSYSGNRSDATKIISLDYTSKKIKISNLQRDITVFIPGNYQNYGHINWAYAYGGSKLAVQTINYNLDLDITKYVVVPYAGFINIINQLGGVDIKLTKLEAAALNGETITNSLTKHYMYEGINHLDGYDALAYSRQRFIDSDFERVKRQNKVIQAVVSKIKSLPYTELFELVKSILPYVTTDLENEEMKSYLMDIMSFDLNDIQQYTWPNDEYDGIYRNKVLGGYLLKSYKNQLVDLHKFIWGIDNYIPSKVAIDNIDNIYRTFGTYKENGDE